MIELRRFALAASLAALTLTGCAGGVQVSAPATATPIDPPSPSKSASKSASESASESVSSSPASSPASSPSSSATPTAAGVPMCTLDDLRIGVDESVGGGAAGSRYVLVTFDNRGRRTCSMYGFPGVSWVGNGNGTQIGAAATRIDVTPERIVLKRDSSTASLLRIVQAGNYGDSCRQSATDGFRVYPPGSKTAAYAEYGGTGCLNFDITVLEVGPVGHVDR